MTIEDLLFAMCDDNNDFLDDAKSSIKCGSHESDEGCCILNTELLSPGGGGGKGAREGGESMRRVKSTPNLLQIPSPHRHRKRSDDSAVGSAEETESYRSNDSLPTGGDASPTEETPSSGIMEKYRRSISSSACSSSSANSSPCNTPTGGGFTSKRISLSSASSLQISSGTNSTSNITSYALPSSSSSSSATAQGSILGAEGKLLRPPSVVISDHDLCQEGYITLEELDAEFDQQQQRRRFSDCSTCSSLSFSESDLTALSNEDDHEEAVQRVSKWKKLQTYIHHVTPFIQTYHNRNNQPWIQLAGHQGNFKSGRQHGTILKKFCAREKEALEILMNDELQQYIPKYYDHYKDEEGSEFIELEDLLGYFSNPCVMDCKIGVRTYLEEELMKAKEKPKLRKDMYEKMCLIDPDAPLPEEHQLRGVTKPRYMVWRETISTTANLGFRIEGIRRSDGSSSKDFKTTKYENQVKEAFSTFVNGRPDIVKQYLERLYELKTTLAKSQFFSSHEVIGSSLLFVHDSTKASVWMIDFAKTCPLPEGCPPISHDKVWALGNHEDGYLIGLSNLIKFFEDMISNE